MLPDKPDAPTSIIWDWCDALTPKGDPFAVHDYSCAVDPSGGMDVVFDRYVNLIFTKIQVTKVVEAEQGTTVEPTSPTEKKYWTALWDTSTPKSMMSYAMAKELQLPVVEQTFEDIAEPDNENEVGEVEEVVPFEWSQCLINLHLPCGTLENIQVYLMPKEGEACADFFIGLDVIQKGDFVVSNGNDRTQMSFRIPSRGPLQFGETASV